MTTTSTDKTQRPPWAERVLAALADAGAYGHTPKEGAEQRLTRGELDLLDGIAYRLRGRLGERTPVTRADMGQLGDAVLSRAMELIAAEQAQGVTR